MQRFLKIPRELTSVPFYINLDLISSVQRGTDNTTVNLYVKGSVAAARDIITLTLSAGNDGAIASIISTINDFCEPKANNASGIAVLYPQPGVAAFTLTASIG